MKTSIYGSIRAGVSKKEKSVVMSDADLAKKKRPIVWSESDSTSSEDSSSSSSSDESAPKEPTGDKDRRVFSVTAKRVPVGSPKSTYNTSTKNDGFDASQNTINPSVDVLPSIIGMSDDKDRGNNKYISQQDNSSSELLARKFDGFLKEDEYKPKQNSFSKQSAGKDNISKQLVKRGAPQKQPKKILKEPKKARFTGRIKTTNKQSGRSDEERTQVVEDIIFNPYTESHGNHSTVRENDKSNLWQIRYDSFNPSDNGELLKVRSLRSYIDDVVSKFNQQTNDSGGYSGISTEKPTIPYPFRFEYICFDVRKEDERSSEWVCVVPEKIHERHPYLCKDGKRVPFYVTINHSLLYTDLPTFTIKIENGRTFTDISEFAKIVETSDIQTAPVYVSEIDIDSIIATYSNTVKEQQDTSNGCVNVSSNSLTQIETKQTGEEGESSGLIKRLPPIIYGNKTQHRVTIINGRDSEKTIIRRRASIARDIGDGKPTTQNGNNKKSRLFSNSKIRNNDSVEIVKRRKFTSIDNSDEETDEIYMRNGEDNAMIIVREDDDTLISNAMLLSQRASEATQQMVVFDSNGISSNRKRQQNGRHIGGRNNSKNLVYADSVYPITTTGTNVITRQKQPPLSSKGQMVMYPSSLYERGRVPNSLSFVEDSSSLVWTVMKRKKPITVVLPAAESKLKVMVYNQTDYNRFVSEYFSDNREVLKLILTQSIHGSGTTHDRLMIDKKQTLYNVLERSLVPQGTVATAIPVLPDISDELLKIRNEMDGGGDGQGGSSSDMVISSINHTTVKPSLSNGAKTLNYILDIVHWNMFQQQTSTFDGCRMFDYQLLFWENFRLKKIGQRVLSMEDAPKYVPLMFIHIRKDHRLSFHLRIVDVFNGSIFTGSSNNDPCASLVDADRQFELGLGLDRFNKSQLRNKASSLELLFNATYTIVAEEEEEDDTLISITFHKFAFEIPPPFVFYDHLLSKRDDDIASRMADWQSVIAKLSVEMLQSKTQ